MNQIPVAKHFKTPHDTRHNMISIWKELKEGQTSKLKEPHKNHSFWKFYQDAFLKNKNLRKLEKAKKIYILDRDNVLA